MKNRIFKLLCVALCACTVLALFTACKKNKENGDEETVDTPFEDYIISRPDKVSVNLESSIKEIASTVQKRSGNKINVVEESKRDAYGDIAEIIVGGVDCESTKSVLSALAENSWTLKRTGNEIVIVGTCEALTQKAVKYFIETYVSEKGAITMKDNESHTVEGEQVLTLAKEKKTDFKIVYSKGADDDKAEGDAYYKNGGLDCEVVCANNIRSAFSKRAATSISLKPDHTETEYEILVGATDRKECGELKAQLGVNQYGFKVIGKKIAVFGWNATTMMLASELFTSWIANAVAVDGDGGYILQITADAEQIKDYGDWVVDFPRYNDGTLIDTADGDGSSIIMYYEDTDATAFVAYCDKLEGEGYSLYNSNGIGDNLYSTYKKGDHVLHVWYTGYENSVRIVSSTVSATNKLVPTASDAGAKITESSITQIGHSWGSGESGMGYVITLEDGRFIIIDGGMDQYGNEHKMLYRMLTKLNKRSDGIVIAAWIMTHDHNDHIQVFIEFCKEYETGVKIEKFLYDTPSASATYNTYDVSTLLAEYYTSSARAVGGIEMIRVYTGQKFNIGNAQIEILFTPDDVCPKSIDYYNDASVVFRMTVSGKKLLFLGDIGGNPSTLVADKLCAMYGKELKSDIVQVAHHGFGHGATKQTYTYIDPDIAFFDTSDEYYQKFLNGGLDYDGIYGAVNRYIVNELASTAYTSSKYTTVTLSSGAVEVTELSELQT